jgi:hypothetical protein
MERAELRVLFLYHLIIVCKQIPSGIFVVHQEEPEQPQPGPRGLGLHP